MSKKTRLHQLSLRALAGTLAMLHAAPLPTGMAAESTTRFADVPPGFYAESAIAALAAQGIVSGRSRTTFAPNDNITRAEFAILLVKAMKLPLVSEGPPAFRDVPTNHYAYRFIQTAYQNNLIAGTAPGQFSPNDVIARQDMATMIARALKTSDVPDTIVQTSLPFSDLNRISLYAKKPVAASKYLDVVAGFPDQTFKPLNPASRAAASIMIYKMINVPGEKLQELKEMTNPTVKSIEIAPNPIAILKGQSQQLTAKTYDRNGQLLSRKTVSWSISGDIGTLEGTVFTATKAGSGVITATILQEGQSPVTASANVTVEEPKHLAFTSASYGSFKPTHPVTLTAKVNDENGQPVPTDNNRKLTLTINGPDGQSTVEATTVNGEASFTVNKTKAGTYTATVSGPGTVANGSAAFKVVPGDLAKLKLLVAPSTFIRAASTVELKSSAYDQWDNEVPPVPVTFSVSDSSRGTIGSTNNPAIGTFTAGGTKGPVTITAQYNGKSISQEVTIYASATDLVSGKGDWMMWRDWKNYPVQDTIKRLKDAKVTHVYLLTTTTLDGFFGQDSMDDFLHQAHAAGIAVIGWVYAANKNPYADAQQTIDTLNYATPTGQKFDGLAADLEENLDQWHQEEYIKSVRNAMGPNYPMMAVVYPATWGKSQPWAVYTKYYDIMAPMLYWHYKERPYTYKETYEAVAAEMAKMRELTRQDMPIHMIGQSYNMFTTSNQNPTWEEIQAAMLAAKDHGAIGYSTYRGRTATAEGWAEFAVFKW
ncbi:S-layer homology domain-containing protein [Effusibacillus consociatus]|uniref:S-layer homology domain-containing protein n=1 Tax=Effusibacillus consociatus TaxID=1117041 RepID=A0ABV9Q6E9_9BACL